MAHRLLVPPVRRLEGQARLPLVQHVSENLSANLTRSMMTRDSLRVVKSVGNGKCYSPLAPPQVFVMSGPGYPNDQASMGAGLIKANGANRATGTRGQGAGI
jgi:hypothetical protein